MIVDQSGQNKSIENKQISTSNKENKPQIKPNNKEIGNNHTNAVKSIDIKTKSCETSLPNLSTECTNSNLTNILLQDTLNQNKILMKHLLLNQKLILELIKRNSYLSMIFV